MISRNLLFVPELILDESLASYIARLCQMHSVDPGILMRGLSIQQKKDYDLDVEYSDLVQLIQGTQLTDNDIFFFTTRFSHLREQNLLWLFLSSDRDKGYYKYCPRCLETDFVPYWRWTWRFRHYEVCPRHRIKLLDCCHSCGQRININKRLNKRYVSGENGSIMGFCYRCGTALSDAGSKPIQSKNLANYLELQDVITSACLNGRFKVRGFDENFQLKCLPIFLILSLCELGDFTVSEMRRNYESALKEMRRGRFPNTRYLDERPMNRKLPPKSNMLFELYSFGLNGHWHRIVGKA
ncbi:TniQ family protein [Advenella mimigardefordensis]|uniref:TniQ domain-containing protein n=1 Tax=Advenella mimigardefordensis (strain DSM 17166 / LMG 22922 / DPN7) TaxID=1247726 RepID=W0PED0_ADVMD|nr:hypothetical protein MIM_c31950 [Advenella mimigardefordensis DPN7]